MLEHDGALPLSEGESVALFGRGQFEYLKSGTGSGGRVNCPYVTSIGDELARRVSLDGEVLEYFRQYVRENPYDGGNGWWVPPCQKQPMVDEELVAAAVRRVDKAIFILCRSVGESYDCTKDAGSWYLSEAEEHTIALLSKHFDHLIVVVNGGNIIDMSWVKNTVWELFFTHGRGTGGRCCYGGHPDGGRLPRRQTHRYRRCH